MRSKKINFNVDKLRLCFRQSDLVNEVLSSCSAGQCIERDNYKLFIIDDGKKEGDGEPQQVMTNVILDDGRLLGTLTFNFNSKYRGLCFFNLENRILYDCESVLRGEKNTPIIYVDYIAEDLGLTFNSLTKLEIAADVNFNVISKIRKAIKDYANYDMFVNGNRVMNEKERINGYGEYYERSRERLYNLPTIYISQLLRNSPILRIYNKTTEIQEISGKDYVTEWNGYGKIPIYRIEVSLNWNDFKAWQSFLLSSNSPYPKEWAEINLILSLLGMQEYRQAVWEFTTQRLLYFREKGSHKPMITMLDIAIGEAA